MAGVGIDLAAAGQEQLDRLALAEEGGQAERLEAVDGPGVDGGRGGGQELFEAGDDADGGSLVDCQGIEGRRRDEALDFVGATVIEGVHEWRDRRGHLFLLIVRFAN